MKKFLLMFTSSCCALFISAKQIPLNDAIKVAQTHQNQNTKLRSSTTVNLVKTVKSNSNARTSSNLYYIFNIGVNNGYIIVAADNVCTPVIGYTTEGSYEENNLLPSYVEWMSSVQKGIESAIVKRAQPTAKVKREWQAYLSGQLRALHAAAVPALIKTQWNQNAPYWNSVPIKNSKGWSAYPGGVSVAMAQIMKYHDYPEKGLKTIPAYTTLTLQAEIPAIDITLHMYDWKNMAFKYTQGHTDIQKQAVADLIFHCGASVEMDYDFTINSAYLSDVDTYNERVSTALIQYFGYNNTISHKYRKDYSDEEWIRLLKTDLNNSLPVYYSGFSETRGHAFVCDGYDVHGLFHFNWGADGKTDGYFSIDALLTYTLNHIIINDIKPGTPSLSSIYHKEDKEELRKFLRQEKNFSSVGLAIADTLNWNDTEDWIKKVQGITWTEVNENKKIKAIHWTYKFANLTGNFKASPFTELQVLNLQFNSLKRIDLSGATALTTLDCSSNQLTHLDVSQNTALEYLNCTLNQLTLLDVSKNTALTNLQCAFNRLTQLNLSGSASLTYLNCNNNQLASLDVSKCTGLISLRCYFNQLTQLDVSMCTVLTNLQCNDNQLTRLNVSGAAALTDLHCYSNKLTGLNITNNKDLRALLCYSNQLTSLDISQNTELTKLRGSSNQLTLLDVSNNVNLIYLYCDSNKLTHLDVSKNNLLKVLNCASNQLSELDVSQIDVTREGILALTSLTCHSNKISNLKTSKEAEYSYLDCNSNQLKFSSLPLSYVSNFNYIPQATIQGEDIIGGEIIDLSSEYSIEGYLTTYTWYNERGEIISPVSAGTGKFLTEKANAALTCKMTNERFPDLILEYKVNVHHIDLTYHLKLKTNNNHLLATGTLIQVYAQTNAKHPDHVKFAIYNPMDGYFHFDMEVVSKDKDTYILQLPQNIQGSYMIAPYYQVNGQSVMMSRTEGSAWIDRIPVELHLDEWAYSKTTYNALEVTNYMKLNINSQVNQIFEVDKNKSFMVYSPTSNPNSTQIGLFHPTGKFYKNITTGRSPKNPSTYHCMIPEDVLSGDFIIMPYNEVGGQPSIVERNTGYSYLIDRLPIHILEEDIWEFSLKAQKSMKLGKTSTEIDLYPNPVVNYLYINTPEPIVSAEIYSISGQFIRRIENLKNPEVNVQSLLTGTYLLLIKTNSQQKNFRFIKE